MAKHGINSANDMMRERGGIGKLSVRRLARVLASSQGVIDRGMVCAVLKVKPLQANAMLSQWSRAGWICRVSRGVYVPVPLETEFADEGEEDPWLIASHLFSPCYIGGWSAAEMWHLTDQIFQTVVVFTTHYFRTKNRRIGSTEYLLKKVTEEGMVGLSTVWRERGGVKVSDPSKTIADIFTYPSLGGGILHCTDIFRAYLRSEHRDLNRIAEYISCMPNRVAFKRLGFVAEHLCSEEVDFISVCAAGITRGYSLLDSRLKGGRHVSRWQLKVPLDLLEGRFD